MDCVSYPGRRPFVARVESGRLDFGHCLIFGLACEIIGMPKGMFGSQANVIVFQAGFVDHVDYAGDAGYRMIWFAGMNVNSAVGISRFTLLRVSPV
jgi:hypothetical protein